MDLRATLSQREVETIIKEYCNKQGLKVKSITFGFLEIIPPVLQVELEFLDKT
jgi:hypothetical protein